MSLKPYCKQSIQLHYMDTDRLVLSFNANQENVNKFLKQNKDEFDFSEFDKSHELYNPNYMKVIEKMKIEISPVLVLHNFTALQSKSFCFSYQRREA